MTKKKLLRILGYVAFGIFALFFCLYVTFPAQAVGQRLAFEVQKLSNGKLNVSFSEVSLYRLTGVSAEGVTIKTIPERGEPTVIKVDEIAARIRLLPLILFDFSVSAMARIGEGSIAAVVTKSGDAVEVAAEVEEIDVAKPGYLAQRLGLPVRGKLGGRIDAAMAFAAPRSVGGAARASQIAPDRTEGTASISLDGLSIGPGTVQGFTVPAPISFGQLDLALDMRKGRVRVASFTQEGGQVAADVSGTLSFRRTARASSLDSCVKLKFTDEEYLSKYPKIKTALQLAQVQLQKDGQGFMHIKHTGTLGNPRRQRGLCRSGPSTPRRRGGRN